MPPLKAKIWYDFKKTPAAMYIVAGFFINKRHNMSKKSGHFYHLKAFLISIHAATSIEYALIAGLISIGIIAGVTLMGDNVAALFNNVAAVFP